MDPDTPPIAFLASRLEPMRAFRRAIYELGQELDRPVYVAEHSDLENNRRSLEAIQVACFHMIRASGLVIAVLDGSYGTSAWSDDELSILDTELFMAAWAQKPLRVFLLQPFDPDPRLENLLHIIRISNPEALDAEPRTEDAIKAEIERLLRSVPRPRRSFHGHHVQTLAVERTLGGRVLREGLDVRFARGAFSPVLTHQPDPDFVARVLAEAETEAVIPHRVARLWVAYRHLSHLPYTDARHTDVLPLWVQLLGQWASASAWYGLHGHLYLGRLAALNTLQDLKARLSEDDFDRHLPERIHGSSGGLASEYHSIAKRVPSWRVRRTLERRALGHANDAFQEGRDNPSSLHATRGNIYLALLAPRQAQSDFEAALRLRAAENDPSRTGEALVDVGVAHLFQGRWRRAQALMEEGVHLLEQGDRIAFTVRAMRKLCWLYGLTLQRGKAHALFHRAYDLGRVHGVEGQLVQLRTLARRLRLR